MDIQSMLDMKLLSLTKSQIVKKRKSNQLVGARPNKKQRNSIALRLVEEGFKQALFDIIAMKYSRHVVEALLGFLKYDVAKDCLTKTLLYFSRGVKD